MITKNDSRKMLTKRMTYIKVTKWKNDNTPIEHEKMIANKMAVKRIMKKNIVTAKNYTLTLFYTPYGWTAMHWLWKITQQNNMK